MSKIVFIVMSFIAMAVMARAGTSVPTPGPLLGAVAGPWGLVASVAAYGAYRLHKAKR